MDNREPIFSTSDRIGALVVLLALVLALIGGFLQNTTLLLIGLACASIAALFVVLMSRERS